MKGAFFCCPDTVSGGQTPLPAGHREAAAEHPPYPLGASVRPLALELGFRQAVSGVFFFETRTPRLSNKKGGAEQMAAKAGARIKITLRCSECKQRNYNTFKNKKNTPDRLELNKYCPFCRKHTVHNETK